jgi:hypothetical protein
MTSPAWARAADEIVRHVNIYIGTVTAEQLERDIEQIIAAHAPASGWRAIDSAPKDGTRVLVFADGEQRAAALLTAVEDGEQNWVYARRLGSAAIAFVCHPTHWQPLPEPPAPPEAAP